ncbi:MAG: hypothetical protein IJI37_06440 [Opitutales bacterium]|nr:hypothetical protein [Opitutales bacterium]
MKQYPIEDIKAPAYLFINGSVLFMKDNIKVQKVSNRLDVPTSHNIKAGDILTDQQITIKGSPVAFSNINALFGELSLAKGALLPKISGCYIAARVASGTWVKWSFAPCVHDTIGSITFGSNLPMGEHGWTVYPDPLNPTSPMVSSSELQAAPSVGNLVDAGKFMLRCLGIYGSGNSAIDFDTDGASIDISLSTEDATNDRLIKWGKVLTDISVSAKFKPRNITLANWQTLTGILATDNIGAFSGVNTYSNLVLRGAKSGDYAFTLASARCKDPSATFSPKDGLMDELEFEALGDAFGDNKLAISTANADFEFEEEEQES